MLEKTRVGLIRAVSVVRMPISGFSLHLFLQETGPGTIPKLLLLPLRNGGDNRMAAHKIAGERVLFLEQSTPLLCLDRESADKKVSPSQRAKYIAVNVFLIFHILAIACWCLPIDSPLIPLCRNLVRPYFLWAGLFQSWDMFAPVPKGALTPTSKPSLSIGSIGTAQERPGRSRGWSK